MVRLCDVDEQNIWQVIQLSVREDQKNYVATNTESLLEAYLTIRKEKVALPKVIYAEDTMVGFVMFGYDAEEEEDPVIAKGNYCLWRFMIDERYQGKGYGKAALLASLAYLATVPCGQAEYCWLSYEPENQHAKKLYEAVGFQENGEVNEGELIAVRKL